MKGINRRKFLLGAASAFAFAQDAAFAVTESAVGTIWPGWKRGEFQIHFIYTGVAESQFMIFPDGTSLLLDCGDHAAVRRGELALPVLPSPARHAGEWIARYVKRVNPHGDHVDYMMISHFHCDHAGHEKFHAGRTTGRDPDYFLSGFAQAGEFLHFDTAIDRGWPNYNDPLPLADDYQGGVLGNLKALYRHLVKRDGLRVEKFRLGAADQIVMRHGGEGEGFQAFNFCGNGRIADERTGKITDLYAGPIAKFRLKALNENGMSLGMLFHVGQFTYYTAGDFTDNLRREDGRKRQIEDDLATVMRRVNVAKSIITVIMPCSPRLLAPSMRNATLPACGIGSTVRTTRWRHLRQRLQLIVIIQVAFQIWPSMGNPAQVQVGWIRCRRPSFQADT